MGRKIVSQACFNKIVTFADRLSGFSLTWGLVAYLRRK